MNKLVLRRHELFFRVVSILDVNEMLEMKRCNNKWREVLVVFISLKPWYKYECTKWGKEKGKCLTFEKKFKVVSTTYLFDQYNTTLWSLINVYFECIKQNKIYAP